MHILMVTIFLATFLSIGGCGLHISARRRPSLLIAVASAFLGSAAAWMLYLFAVDGALAFTPAYWLGDAKPGGLDIVLPLIAIGTAISLIPASIVVAIAQAKFRRLTER
jgi:hypothetical protein